MGRITQDELDRIKRDVSVADLARRRGVELAPHGKDLIGLCAFHNDHEPSLVITPDKNLWHCLGACQQGGDVIAWVMKAEGVSFRQAVELLRRHDVALTPATARAVVKVGTVKKLPCPIAADVADQTALHQVVNFYTETLKDSPEALAYLEKRRIGHAGAIDHFKLGYANRTLGYYLPDSNREAGAKLRGQLQRLGVYSVKGHERFNGSVVIPVIDEDGAVREMYGRKIRDDLRPGTAYHLYLNGPHRGVWNVSALMASKEIILCESLIDAVTFWCFGYRNVTASYGVEGFRPDHMDAFKRHGIERVLIAYDGDDAGRRAVSKLAPVLMKHGFEVFDVRFGLLDKDANEVACHTPDPADALGVLLRGAAWIGKGARPVSTPPPASPTSEARADTTSTAGADSSPTTPPAAAKGKEAAPEYPPAPDSALALLDSIFPLAESSPAPEPLTPAPPDPAAPDPREHPPSNSASCTAPGAMPSMASCVPTEALAKPEAAETPAGAGHLLDEVFDGRAWRIRGLEKNTSYEILKLNVRVSFGDRHHMHTFDLANAGRRADFLKAAAVETNLPENLLKDDLRKLLLKLEEMQDALIQKTLAPRAPVIVMSEAEQAEAMEFLKSPDLMDWIARDFEQIGMVGETTNLLTGYLAAVSRKLDAPLHLLMQSMTAAGKTAVMDAILKLMPPEDVVDFSEMTGQALFYLDDVDLRHKILTIAEEAGAQKAGYSIKLFMSDGKLVIASTMKDAQTGNLIARRKERLGPASVFMTTTNLSVSEELANRMLIETVNEDREQTKRIHELQRESKTLAGLLKLADRDPIRRRHHNAQRLLRPLMIAIPSEYAKRLTFLDTCLRTRRDHMKYLTLIQATTLLHQYQRPIRQVRAGDKVVSYIDVTVSDIEQANRLADEVLGRSLDEMPAPTRRLLERLDEMVTARCAEKNIQRADFRFSRRDVSEFTGMRNTQVKDHLRKLEELEYVLVHRGGRGISFEYELLYDGRGRDGRKFCMGLIDVTTLKQSESLHYDGNLAVENTHLAAEKPNLAVSKRPHSGGFAAGSRKPNFGAILTASKASRALLQNWAKTHILKNGRRPPAGRAGRTAVSS